MPFTFLAHQGPFLPVVRRWSHRIDPVTFLVGTVAPDLAYVAGQSSWRVWAHAMPWLVAFNVPVTLLVSWIVVRIIAPVLPAHLPEAGSFRLRDLRAIAAHRFDLVRSPVWALIGSFTHVALDSFTHRWGWVASEWRWYRTPLIDHRWLGKDWAPFEVAQFFGHVVGSALCVYLLWRYGRERALATAAAAVPLTQPTSQTNRRLWLPTAAAFLASILFVVARPSGEADDVIRVATALFLGLTIGSISAARVLPATSRSPLIDSC